METKQLKNITEIVIPYKKVIEAWKKRGDVQNGWKFAYRPGQNPNNDPKFEDWSKSIGFIGTTGFCVSASQALLLDPVFQLLIQDRGAKAKLVSIDIREQYYGHTYSGSQNKWHTAILVEDNDPETKQKSLFIIDVTCGQFNGKFSDKSIWDFQTWEKTFRSPFDKHILTDFENSELTFLPKETNTVNTAIAEVDIIHRLHDVTTLTDPERKIIANFFLKNYSIFNTKLLLGNLTKFDFKYLEEITNLFKHLYFVTKKNQYYVMEFSNKTSALNWIEKFLKNNQILQQFMIFSDSIEKSCKYFGFDSNNINSESLKDRTYIVLDFEYLQGIDVSFLESNVSICLPYGAQFSVDKKDIFNGGKLLSPTVENIERKTNTIFIKSYAI